LFSIGVSADLYPQRFSRQTLERRSVARRRPELQFRITHGPHLQQVVTAAIVQFEAADRLAVTPIEAFSQPQDRGQRPHDAPRAATEVAETLMAALGSGLAMIPGHERDDVHFLRLEAA
jgi:hypothetical protein